MASTGDIVLVYQEENPAFFARIEDITADGKKDWYQIKLLVLQIPVVEIVWILRESYINGETFTMNEKKMRLEAVAPAMGLSLPSSPVAGEDSKKKTRACARESHFPF